MCVYDVKPRELTLEQKNALLAMSKQVVNLFEQRYQNLKLTQLRDKLEKRNEDLKKFASVVSHDLKSPLANIISLTELLEDDNKDNLNAESLQYLEYLRTSSYSLRDYIDGILKFYKSDDIVKNNEEEIAIDLLIEELKKITDSEHKIDFNLSSDVNQVFANKTALMQILINLITNAIKYNSKSEIVIDIALKEEESFYIFSVKDNGDGIPKDFLDKIFDLFTVVGVEDLSLIHI